MKYKHAKADSERQSASEDYISLTNARPYLKITEWNVNDIKCDNEELGLTGSPTKVKAIENVVFAAKESKQLGTSDDEMDDLIKDLFANHTIG